MWVDVQRLPQLLYHLERDTARIVQEASGPQSQV